MEILQKITELKSELDGLRPLSKDREAAIMQKLRLDWNYHSNHLEPTSSTNKSNLHRKKATPHDPSTIL